MWSNPFAFSTFSAISELIVTVISVMAYRASKQNISFFQRHRGLTYTFLALWLISVGSGEVLYFAVWY